MHFGQKKSTHTHTHSCANVFGCACEGGRTRVIFFPPRYSADTNNSSHLLVITTDTRHHRDTCKADSQNPLGGVHERTVARGERHFPDRCTLVKINIYSQLLLKAPHDAQFTYISGFLTVKMCLWPEWWRFSALQKLHFCTSACKFEHFCVINSTLPLHMKNQ